MPHLNSDQFEIAHGDAKASRLRPRLIALMAAIGALLLLAACLPLPVEEVGDSADSNLAMSATEEAQVIQATTALADELGVDADAIEVTSIEAVEWGDSSLGCPEEGMMYAAVITPGYQITLTHAGDEYIFHTGADADGPVINCTEAGDSTSNDGTSEPVTDSTEAQLVGQAKEDLSAQLGVGVGAIETQSVEAVEWNDSSLGCPQPDMMYAQVITSGYRITLVHAGEEYVYHTSADADSPVISCGENAAADAAEDAKEPVPMLTTRETLVARAVDDLAQRQGVEPSAVEVKSIQGVEWRDGSLGCAKAGMMYPQVITPGYRITLSVDGVDYAYHTGGRKDGPVKYCNTPQKSGADDGTYQSQ